MGWRLTFSRHPDEIMKSDPETLVDAFYAAWRALDPPAALAYCTDDVHIVFHFGPMLLFSGECRGKEAALRQLTEAGKGWEYLELKQFYNSVEPGLVRCTCPFVFRHTRSRAILEGTLRHVFTLRDGQIAKFEAFLDVALLNSFLRMAGWLTGPTRAKTD